MPTRMRLLALTLIVILAGAGAGAAMEPDEGPAPPADEPPAAAPPREGAQASELPRDEEDSWWYRALGAPALLWEGMTYPVKELSIFYERVNLLERMLDLFLNDERTGGVYPRFALGGVISSGIGFTAFHNDFWGQGEEARLSYILGVRENQSADLFYRDPSLLDSPYAFETELNLVDFDEGRFFAAGNEARERDQRFFALTQFSWTAKVTRPVVGDLAGAVLTRVFAGRGSRSDQNAAPISPATPGVDTTVVAIEVEPGAKYDSRDNPFSPSRGWLFDTALTYTEQLNRDDFRYLAYTLEVQRYVPVFRGGRILVLRGLLAKQSPLGDASIPFYELNALDVNHGLRGYDRGRWRDRGRLLFTAEWRFPVWDRLDGSLFYDAGQVFRNFRDLETKTFRYSAGFGFRFATTRQFAFRAHVAMSEDRLLALIRGDLEFQRKRGTVLGGL